MLAQLSSQGPSTGDLGLWLMCAVVVIGGGLTIAEKFKKLFWPAVPSDAKPVEVRELQDVRATLAGGIAELKASLASCISRHELQRFEDRLNSLAADHKDLSKYTHAVVDELKTSFGKTQLRIETLHREIHADIEKLAGGLAIRLEEHSTRLAAVAALLDHIKDRSREE